MAHSCSFLCSQLVKVVYEDHPGELRQATANLEEISTNSAVVLLEEKPRLGSPILLAINGHDLFGVITSSLYDATLGWFVTAALDPDSTWRRDWFTPKHLLARCGCSLEGVSSSKARALENTRDTEENVPVSFVVREG
jgi:hypothetical protein